MADHATPNLPSRDFEATSRFYGGLGFVLSPLAGESDSAKLSGDPRLGVSV